MPVLRIYADFNGLVNGPNNSERTAVVIDTFGSLRDLANAGVILREGQAIVAFDESDESEDLEGHGKAAYDKENGWWAIEFDGQGVRYVPAGDRTPVEEFRCVNCKTALTDFIESNGLNLGDECPNCETEIHAPIAPPAS